MNNRTGRVDRDHGFIGDGVGRNNGDDGLQAVVGQADAGRPLTRIRLSSERL